jgi:hypothetical protein
MNLPIPVVGVDPGPDWATNLNTSLTILDAHNHTPGAGVQIPVAGLNINGDLPLNSNNLTLIRSSRYVSQSAPLATPVDIGCLYVSGADLYYNDTSGTQIRLTQGGSPSGGGGSITGLVSPASASYSSGTSTFVWQSAVNTAANMDAGSVILRNITAGSKGLTLQPPSSMGADYALTLPSLPPGQQIMTCDASGLLSAPYTVDGSTLTIASNVIKVANGGITSTQINSSAGILGSQLSASANISGSQLSASAGIVGTQIASQTIKQSNLALRTTGVSAPAGGVAVGSQINLASNSSGVTNQLTLSTAIISIASPAVISTVSTVNVSVGQTVFFTTTGSLPTGIVAGTIYYVSNIVTPGTSFNISAAPGGASINTSGSQSGTHTANADLTSISLTTTGRPICVGLGPISGTSGYIGISLLSGSTNYYEGRIYIGSNGSVANYQSELRSYLQASQSVYLPTSSIQFLDFQSAGIYTYSLYVSNISSTTMSTFVQNARLIAYEI